MTDHIIPTEMLRALLMSQACHELGIVPITNTRHDVNRALAALQPDEARKMRRRFRKLWRKFAKNSNKVLPSEYVKQFEMGCGEPTRRARSCRKAEVRRRIISDVVNPAVERGSAM